MLNALILLFISGIHFYWAFGGRRWLNSVIPEMKNKPIFAPGKIATLLVAVGLMFFALIHLSTENADIAISPMFVKSTLLIIAGIFFLRAIGDFNYVGFFKKVKDSTFAKNDSYYYSPLCLLLSVNALLTYIYFI